MNAYEIAAKYLAIIQKAGARHNAKDTDLVQQMHDRACELGAKCQCEEMTVHPTLRAAVEALILRHPGHPNQKVHGNRFGGYEVTKESLRRLKGDKEGRERYKASARKKGSGLNAKQLSTVNRLRANAKAKGITFGGLEKLESGQVHALFTSPSGKSIRLSLLKGGETTMTSTPSRNTKVKQIKL